jgi:hypothetical protein
MRDVYEVDSPAYPGAEPVWEAPPGYVGAHVRLAPPGTVWGAPVFFVDSPAYPGATAVQIMQGGPRQSVHDAMAYEHHRRAAPPAPAPTLQGPPDPRLLSDDHRELQAALNSHWERVNATRGGDEQALAMCARLGALGLTVAWPDPRWLENLLMMGGNAAVMHWQLHREHALAVEVLPVLASAIEELGWHRGGPSNLFEGHEAQAILAARSEI